MVFITNLLDIANKTIKEEFSKNNRALKLQGMKIDGLKMLMEKHREMADKKSNQDKKALLALLDTMQSQLAQAEERNHKVGNALLNDTKEIKIKFASTLGRKPDWTGFREL